MQTHLRSLALGATVLVAAVAFLFSGAPAAHAVNAAYHGVDFISSSTGWVVGRDATILRTSNGGRTWTRQHSETGGPILLDVSALADGRHCWAVGTGGAVFRTADGGRTWRRVTGFNIPDPSADLTSVKFVSATTGWVCGGQQVDAIWPELPWGGIWRTTDGGRTWSAPAAAFSGWCPVALDASSAHAATCWGILRTTAGGTPTNDPGFVRTTDGVTWSSAPATAHLPGGSAAVADFDQVRGRMVAVGSFTQALTPSTWSFTSADHGSLYVRVLPPVGPTSLAGVKMASETIGYAVGVDAPAVLKTTTGGMTWRVKPTPLGAELLAVDFVGTSTGYAVGLNLSTAKPLVIKTTNGARTWRRVK